MMSLKYLWYQKVRKCSKNDGGILKENRLNLKQPTIGNWKTLLFSKDYSNSCCKQELSMSTVGTELCPQPQSDCTCRKRLQSNS